MLPNWFRHHTFFSGSIVMWIDNKGYSHEGTLEQHRQWKKLEDRYIKINKLKNATYTRR